MAVTEYRRALEAANLLSEGERTRLIRELAARLVKFRKRPDLSQVEEAVAYVEGMRMAESRHPSGRLKTPAEFLAALNSWEG